MPLDPVYNFSRPITPSDTVNIDGTTYAAQPVTRPIPPQAISIGAAGNIAAVWENGTTTTMAVQAGAILPIKVIRINATNTTATGLVALYTV